MTINKTCLSLVLLLSMSAMDAARPRASARRMMNPQRPAARVYQPTRSVATTDTRVESEAAATDDERCGCGGGGIPKPPTFPRAEQDEQEATATQSEDSNDIVVAEGGPEQVAASAPGITAQEEEQNNNDDERCPCNAPKPPQQPPQAPRSEQDADVKAVSYDEDTEQEAVIRKAAEEISVIKFNALLIKNKENFDALKWQQIIRALYNISSKDANRDRQQMLEDMIELGKVLQENISADAGIRLLLNCVAADGVCTDRCAEDCACLTRYEGTCPCVFEDSANQSSGCCSATT